MFWQGCISVLLTFGGLIGGTLTAANTVLPVWIGQGTVPPTPRTIIIACLTMIVVGLAGIIHSRIAEKFSNQEES